MRAYPMIATAALALTGGMFACGKAAQDSTNAFSGCQSGSASGSALALSSCDADTGTASASGSTSAPSGAALFDYCRWNASDKGGCMVCTPRDLAVSKCATTVKADFDAAKDCTSNATTSVLSCEVGGNSDFTWNLSEESKTESLYKKLPLLIFGAKYMIADKVKDAAKKELFDNALDLVAKHAKVILNNGDIGPAADDVIALVKKARPALSDAVLAATKAKVVAAVAAVQAKRQAGDLSEGDMIALLSGFITKMPTDLVGDSLKGVDLDALTKALTGAGSGDLMAILAAFSGAGSASGSGS